MDKEYLHSIFKQLKFKSDSIKLMTRNPERTKTWGEYETIVITDDKIRLGVRYLKQHLDTFKRLSHKYDVPVSILIGILGIETLYGKITGKFRAADVLATLAFGYDKRATFFKKELAALFVLAKQTKFDVLSLKSSYAGALGIPQFMPSSYLDYAASASLDPKQPADIWNNPEDAIASIGYYLKRHHWQKEGLIAIPVTLKSKVNTAILFDNNMHSVQELKQAGFQFPHSLNNKILLKGLKLEGKTGPVYWAVAPNFNVIKSYNPSTLYALSVYRLGKQILMKYTQEMKTKNK